MWTRLLSWIKAPTFDGDEDQTRAAALLNIIIWIFAVVSSLYGLLAPIEPEMRLRRAVIIIPFVFVMLVLKQVIRHGYVRFAGGAIIFFLWLMFTMAMFFGADYRNPAYMGYVIVVICAGLILNWRAAMAWSLFSVITSATIVYFGISGTLPRSPGTTPAVAFWTAQTAYILVASVLISQSLRKVDQAFAKAQHELNERERVEAERERFIRELESKNEELERFTYTVSHDLKSPLITIGGFLGFLEKDVREGNLDKFENDVQRMREATTKMQDLLNDLLELSRIGRLTNPPELIPFESIVREALSLVEGRLANGHIAVSIQKDMPKVYGDRIRLVEVLQNLLDNAAKFVDPQRQQHIEVGTRSENGEQVFFVKDNGIGIQQVHHQRVFGLFNKLNPNGEGTGIGLALVKRTIEVHGGRVWIESTEAEGTTFNFTLAEKPS